MDNLCLNYEYDGILDNESYWKDHPFYFTVLNVTQEIEAHDGCVNTICWDDTGECLLSGSDDRRIAITRLFSGYTEDKLGDVVFSQKLPPMSNIFTAKFMPYTLNKEIIVGFKCGCVVHVNIDAPTQANNRPLYCHSFAVYDIVPLPDHYCCFLSLSHDHSVICYDTRQPSYFGANGQFCSRSCYDANSYRSKTRSPHFVAALQCADFLFPVTAADIHPIDGSRCIALASADGFVRLFDIRRLFDSANKSSPSGKPAIPTPFRLARPLGLPAQPDNREEVRLDYGPAHITSVRFEPLYPSPVACAFTPLTRGATQRTNLSGNAGGGRRLLVSHMYAPVFLFDLYKDEVESDASFNPPDWLPPPEPTPSQVQANDANETRTLDSNILFFIALLNWRERQRAARVRSANERAATQEDEAASEESESEETVEEGRESARSSEAQSPSSRSQDQSETSNRRMQLPFNMLSDEMVADVLASAARCKQLMAYRGRLCCRTVIKSSCFWGRDYILAGSECGHIIAWDRSTGNIVNAIKGDGSVVNRIAPHPHLPLMACSGIDRTIKIIEPKPQQLDRDGSEPHTFNDFAKRCQEKAEKLCDTNVQKMRDALRGSSDVFQQLTRFRMGRAARFIFGRMIGNSSSQQ